MSQTLNKSFIQQKIFLVVPVVLVVTKSLAFCCSNYTGWGFKGLGRTRIDLTH